MLTDLATIGIMALAIIFMFLISPGYSFSVANNLGMTASSTGTCSHSRQVVGPLYSTTTTTTTSSSSRRSFVHTSAATAFSTFAVFQSNDVANAMPMVTVFEFEQILKDSAKSVSGVALSGPKLETAVVTLIDGTQFGISDIYESPSDPRSPLKLIATCRSYNVPTKSVALEEAVLSLSSEGSKKKRVYMNERVRIAAEKEREKKLRMEQDELERQAELERMGQN